MSAAEGPIIGSIIKPSIGLTADETAALVDQLAGAGIDFIKDDELQSNGPGCPLRERAEKVMAVFSSGGGIMSHPAGPGAGIIALHQAVDAARGRSELAEALETFKQV